jgi:hypothetical protein
MLESVAEIFCATNPPLPIPETTSRVPGVRETMAVTA